MISFVSSNGTSINLMTPEGHALAMAPAKDQQIRPSDITEFIEWLKHDALRCYVAVDAFGQIALQQLFPPMPHEVRDNMAKQAVEPVAETE